MNKEWAVKIIFPIIVSVVTAVIINRQEVTSLRAEVVNEQYHIRVTLQDIKNELKEINKHLRGHK